MKSIQALMFAAPLLAQASKVDYAGYKVFKVDLPEGNVADVEAELEQLSAVDVSECRHAGDHMNVAVPPSKFEAFDALNLTYDVLNEDLGALIQGEGELTRYPGKVQAASGSMAVPDESWFNSYHPYEDHLEFLSDLQAAFPNGSELFTAGKSFEGRDLQGIHLWGSGGPGKEAVIWHGNVHAREWITSMTVEYLGYQLVTNGASFLDTYDFYLIPVVNPDGFVYTQTNNRLWRKNRQQRSGISAIGTDVNRNWPYKWEGAGSSTQPGSETYRGQTAGDTPENKGLREWSQKLADGPGIKFFVDWHSYSQLILLPYGYSCGAEVDNLSVQMDLAEGVADAIAGVEGTQFEYGPTCETIYQTNGGSNDYYQDVQNTEFAWSFELRDTGEFGFVLPPNQILPTGEEMWEGVKYMLENM